MLAYSLRSAVVFHYRIDVLAAAIAYALNADWEGASLTACGATTVPSQNSC